MAITLSDDEIAGLLREQKPLPPDYKTKLQLKPRRGHKEQELNIKGADGNDFRIILRLSDFNHLDFSVILGYMLPNSNQLFRLRRYNGKSHEHTNTIEGEKFYGFHIHQATARYQEIGKKEDSYATPTDRFVEYQGAIQCLISDCNFTTPGDLQTKLF